MSEYDEFGYNELEAETLEGFGLADEDGMPLDAYSDVDDVFDTETDYAAQRQAVEDSLEIFSLPAMEEDDENLRPTRADDSMRKWIAFAACKGASDVFYIRQGTGRTKESTQRTNQALGICATCPVLKPCLEHALSERETDGVWGGTTEGVRKRLRRAMHAERLNPEQLIDLSNDSLVYLLGKLGQSGVTTKRQMEQGTIRRQDPEAAALLDTINTKPPNQVTLNKPSKEPIVLDLWDDQVECLEGVGEAFEAGERNVLYQMSPSRGKTTVAGKAIKDKIEQNPEIRRVGFFCHSKELLKQGMRRFEEILGGGHRYELFTGRPQDNEHDDDETGVLFKFAPFRLLYSRLGDFEPDFFDIIVVDEAHRARAPTFERVIDYFKPRFYLAMTATPRRLDTLDAQELFGPTVFSQSLAETLSEEGMVKLVYKMFANDDEAFWKQHDIRVDDIDQKIFVPQRDEVIVQTVADEVEARGLKQPRMLVFANSKEHADRLAKSFPNAESWHSNRKHTLKGFREGKYTTLVAVRMADEGIDVPDIEVVAFLARSDSPTKFVQQLGRGIRQSPGKDSLLALDFAANCDRLLMVEELVEELASIEELLNETLPPTDKEPVAQPHSRPIPGSNPSSTHREKPKPTTTIQIRTFKNASFEFTPTVVKISERLRALEEDVLPDGTMSATKYCESRGISRQLLYRLLNDMGITTLPIYGIGAARAMCVIPELQADLDRLPELQVKPATKDIWSLLTFAKDIGYDIRTVHRLLEAEGIELDAIPRYKFGSITTHGLDKALRERLRNSSKLAEYQPPAEGESSREHTAKELGIHRSRVDRAVVELNLKMTKRQVHTGPVDILTKEQKQQIRTHLGLDTSPAEPGDLTPRAYAALRKVEKGVVNRLVKKHELELETKLVGTMSEPVITRAQQAILEANYDGFNVPPGPPGWRSVKTITVDINCARKRFEKAMHLCNIKPTIYRTGQTMLASPCLSPDDEATVVAFLADHPGPLSIEQ